MLVITLQMKPALAEDRVAIKHGHAVFGELKYPKDFKHFDFANPDAPKGGFVKFYSLGAFDSLNEFVLKGNKAPSLGYTYESLMYPSTDEPYSQYCLIAESIEVPESKTWVAFNIRPEARWHDGKEITAEDVKFTLETLKTKGDPNYKIIYGDVSHVEVLDKRKVKFHISAPDNPLIISSIGGMPLLPKHFFADKDFEKYDDKPILASGPYKIKAYEFGKFIEYEKVQDYWAKDLPIARGLHNFHNIKFDVYLDYQVAVEAFKSGEYDYRDEMVSRVWSTSYDIEPIKDGKIIKAEWSHKQPANLQTTYLNMRNPNLADIKLREALTLAFDFDWMNKALFYGVYTRTTSYFDNSKFAAKGLPEGKELEILNKFKGQVPEEVFTKEFVMPSTNANPFKNRENLKKAFNILTEAGYKIDKNLLISPHTGKPVVVEVIYHLQQFERMLNAYKDNLAKIGITLNLRFLDHAQYQKRMQTFDFEMTTAAFNSVSIPGNNQRQLWHSSADVDGGYNFSGVHNAAVDYLVDHLSNSKTEEDLIAYARALDRVLLWNYYSIPQMHSRKFRFLYWNKFEMPEIKPDYDVGTETWWMKEDYR